MTGVCERCSKTEMAGHMGNISIISRKPGIGGKKALYRDDLDDILRLFILGLILSLYKVLYFISVFRKWMLCLFMPYFISSN